jgi:CRP-like cAMP-binding protein
MQSPNNPGSDMDQQGTVRSFRKGEIIAREGEFDQGWYVLLSGQVGVFKKLLQIATLEKSGTVFGELSGILNRPRTASLKALDDCKVLYITATIDELIRYFPDVAKKVMINTAERLATTTEELWMAVYDHKQR